MVLSARFEFGLALARPHPGRPPLWLGKATDDEAGGAPMGKGGAEATTGIGGAVAHVGIEAGGGGGRPEHGQVPQVPGPRHAQAIAYESYVVIISAH